MTRTDAPALGAPRPVRQAVARLRPDFRAALRGLTTGESRFRLVAYGVPVAAAALATGTWFSPGAFVAAGDVSPFELTNLASELGSLWNHQTVGTGSTSYAICRLFVVLLSASVHALGFGAVVAQHLYYALVCGFAAFGGAYLAAVWVRRAWPVALAGMLAAFNAYLLVNQPLPLPALAIGLTGLLAGMVLRAAGGAPVRARAVALATLPASVLAGNPPLLVISAGTVLATAAAAPLLAGAGARRRVGRLLARALPLAVLVNLWWLVPYAITLADPAGVSVAASTDVTAWAWTQVRASVDNVATLNSTWAWTHLNYFPYRPAMEASGWIALRWAVPALAVLGVVTAGRQLRRVVYPLAGACVLMIVVGTGQHAPFAAMNLWLLSHLPGGWLLRDPAMKLAVPQVLCYGALAAIGAERLLRPHPDRLWRVGVRMVLAGLTTCALVAVWPLWTGVVIPNDRAPLPGARVTVPASWYQLARVANAGVAGKVLILPLDPFYQVTTDCGYHGADTIPAQLLTRPVVQTLPDGYFDAAGGADALIGGVQTALLDGDRAGALRGLAALGVGQVVVRQDLVVTDPATVGQAAALRAAADGAFTPVASYPVGVLYRVPVAPGPVAAYGSVATVLDGGGGASRGTPPALRAGAVGTSTPGVPTDEVVWRPDGPASFTLATSGAYRLAEAQAAPVYRIALAGRTLQVESAEQTVVDGVPVPGPAPFDLPLGRGAAAVSVGGELRPLTSAGQIVQLGSATTLRAYATVAPSPAMDLSVLGDCAKSAPGRATLTRKSTDPTSVRLGATGHSACVHTTVPLAATAGLYQVSFRYRTVSGRPARFCLLETGLRRCASLPGPATTPGWHTYRGEARIPRGAGTLVVYVYADGTAGGTVVDYAAVHVDRLRQVAVTRLGGASAAEVDARELGAGTHTVSSSTRAVSVLGAPGPLGDCNNSTGQVPADLGLSAQAGPDGSVGLTAPMDIACVRIAASAPIGARYRLDLDYLTASGRPARICLWEVGPGRCASLPALAQGTGWTHLSTPVIPDPGTTALYLYLYADGQRAPVTSVRYRAVRLTLDSGSELHVYPAGNAPPAPGLAVTAHGTSSATVSVTGATGSFALVLPEAAAPGWELSGLPAGWSARRFTADGYAQAWLVTGRGDATLRVGFGPQRYADAAALTSGATIALLPAPALWAWWTRRRRGIRLLPRPRLPRGWRRP